MSRTNTTSAAKSAPATKGNKGATKPASQPATINTNAPLGVPGALPNGLGAMVTALTTQPVKPQAGKAAVAAGTAAAGATARAHIWGQGGQSVGNTAKLPAGSLSITAKGAAYNPKPGYNANAWQAVQAAIKAGPCSATQAASAIGHAGAAWVRYAVSSGWLAVTV